MEKISHKFALLLFCTMVPGVCFAEDVDVCRGPRHNSVRARFTSPKGIGYSKGYGTLQGFFAPRHIRREYWLPFADLRGHLFTDGKWAANGGLGMRYLGCTRVWGLNAYYDYRDTSHGHYNQVAAGFESLGVCYDFRINGYLPVDVKHPSPPFHQSASFESQQLLFHYTQYYPMKGVNAEVGYHLDCCPRTPLYFAIGPYYLTGGGKTAWGGEGRARMDLFHRHLRIEGNASYDHIFKWIGQGQISLNIPFGKRTKICMKNGQDCCTVLTLHQRAIQQVDRFEIIPQVKKRTVTPAINPATGNPWVF